MIQIGSENLRQCTYCHKNPCQTPIQHLTSKSIDDAIKYGKLTQDQLKSILYQKTYHNGYLLVEKEKLENVIDQLKKENGDLNQELRSINYQKIKNQEFFEKEREMIKEFSQKSYQKLQQAKEFTLQKLDELNRKQLERAQNLQYGINQATRQKYRIEADKKIVERKLRRANCCYLSIIAVLALLFMGSCLLLSTLLVPNVCQDLRKKQVEMHTSSILNEVDRIIRQSKLNNECSIM